MPVLRRKPRETITIKMVSQVKVIPLISTYAVRTLPYCTGQDAHSQFQGHSFMLTVDFCVLAQPWNGCEAGGLWVCGVMKFTHVPTESGRVEKLAGEWSKLNKEETSQPAVCLLKASLASGQKMLLPIKMAGATLPSTDTGLKFPCPATWFLQQLQLKEDCDTWPYSHSASLQRCDSNTGLMNLRIWPQPCIWQDGCEDSEEREGNKQSGQLLPESLLTWSGVHVGC